MPLESKEAGFCRKLEICFIKEEIIIYQVCIKEDVREGVAYHESWHGDATRVRGHVQLLGGGQVVLGTDHHAVAGQPNAGRDPGDGEEGGAHLRELHDCGSRDRPRGYGEEQWREKPSYIQIL